jgi:uncharacterized membrane protein YdfJ with MMPL/SSD domain
MKKKIKKTKLFRKTLGLSITIMVMIVVFGSFYSLLLQGGFNIRIAQPALAQSVKTGESKSITVTPAILKLAKKVSLVNYNEDSLNVFNTDLR